MKTELMSTPFVNQLCTRLNQLHQGYGKAAVEVALVTLSAGFPCKNAELCIHLNNLLLTYDYDVIVDAFTIMKYSKLTYSKVG